MIEQIHVGDSVRLVSGFGGEDDTTRARGLFAGQVYRVKALPRDRKGLTWVELHTVDRPSRRYPGWAHFRFEIVRKAPDAEA